MEFGYLGISYKKADLDIRDQVSFTDTKKMDLLQKLEEHGIAQCMILSTCNRSEIYFFYEQKEQFALAKQCYKNMFGDLEIEPYFITGTGKKAIEYLYRVTAGIDSLVIGEDQILGQVKEALDFAKIMGYSKKELNKVVRDAITCAKKIKTKLKISETPLSVSYVGILKLNEVCQISGKTAMLIGSGKTAELALTYLEEYQAKEIYLCSRTLAHAQRLAKKYQNITIFPYENRYELIKQCDILVSATASPHLILKKELFFESLNQCNQKDLTKKGENTFQSKQWYLLDLAAPRDFDVTLGEKEQIHLINLDQLNEIVNKNQKIREELAQKSRFFIESDVKDTIQWLKSSRVDATIASLNQRCEEIVGESYEYLNRKIAFNEHEKKILNKTLHAIAHRLMKEPIEELKQVDTKEKQEEYQKIVENLFHI